MLKDSCWGAEEDGACKRNSASAKKNTTDAGPRTQKYLTFGSSL